MRRRLGTESATIIPGLPIQFQCRDQHQCMACRPHQFSRHARPILEGHVAIRWHLSFGGAPWRITLNGVECARVTYEAVAGARGWVQIYRLNAANQIHRCGCARGICAAQLTGAVTIGGASQNGHRP